MMRGFAAILVALFHFSEIYAPKGVPSPLAFTLNGGYAGVDVFFVISGYIMALVSRDLTAGVGPAFRFFSKRALRIYGGWIPVFLIIAGGCLLLSPVRLTNADLVRSFFLIPQPHSQNLLPVTWSLSYEICFYGLLSVLLLVFRHRTVYAVLFYLLAVLAMRFPVDVLGLTPAFSEYVKQHHGYPNILFSAYTLEFLAGFTVYWLPRRLGVASAACLTVLGVLLFISGMVYIKYALGGKYVGGGLLRAFFFGFSSLLVIAGLVRLEMEKRIRVPKCLLFLGNASYTIYLLHVPVFLLFFPAVAAMSRRTGFPLLQYWWLTAGTAMATLFLISALHYSFVENPIHNRIRVLIGSPERTGT
jgi:peptidoglycan/LPS O-acetylase OafA/YrhL